MIPARACELIGAGVRNGLKRRSKIAPYRIPGPVELTLFDSEGHQPPLKEFMPAVTADTISEAFLKYENAMPWTTFNQQLPDGFVYP